MEGLGASFVPSSGGTDAAEVRCQLLLDDASRYCCADHACRCIDAKVLPKIWWCTNLIDLVTYATPAQIQ